MNARGLPLLITCALAGAVVLASSTAEAVPRHVRLAVGTDASTTMRVAWDTSFNVASMVRYGTESGELTETVSGTTFDGPDAIGFIHEVTLEGLEPGTMYYYQAGSPSDGWSEERTFRTAPEPDERCGSLTFGFLADNRPDETFGGGENYPAVLGKLGERDPAFVLNGGDMVVDGDDDEQWKDFLDWSAAVFDRVPYMPAIGNHDDGPVDGEGAYYNQIFALPRSDGEHGSGTEDYYYFTWGNAIFVSLSTQTFRGAARDFAEQAAWLDRVLTENPKTWKIVYFHHPSYTHQALFDISHEPNEEGQNAAFVPVLDEHHVDLVFTSHNHWYERYEPSNCSRAGRPGSDEPCSTGRDGFAHGTVYVVSGGAGAFTIPAALCGGGILNPVEGRVACADPHHYILVTIEDGELTYEAFDTDRDRVFDSFSISKEIPDCAPAVEPDAGPSDEPDAGGDEEPDTGSDDEPDTSEPPTPDAELDEDTDDEDAASPPEEGEDTAAPDANDEVIPTPQGRGTPASGSSPESTGCSMTAATASRAATPASGTAWLALLAVLAWSTRPRRDESARPRESV